MEADECARENTEWLDASVKRETSESHECSVSEAAIFAELYTDHVVKDELVLGPECVQSPVPNTLSSANLPVILKQEPSETVPSTPLVVPDTLLTNNPRMYGAATSSNEEADIKHEVDRTIRTIDHCALFMNNTRMYHEAVDGKNYTIVEQDTVFTNNIQVNHETVTNSDEEANLEHEVDRAISTVVDCLAVFTNNTQTYHKAVTNSDEEANLEHEVNRTTSTVVDRLAIFTNNTQTYHKAVTNSDEEANLEYEVDRTISTVADRFAEFMNKTNVHDKLTSSDDEKADLDHEINSIVEQDTVFMNKTQIYDKLSRSDDEKANLDHEIDREINTFVEHNAVFTYSTQIYDKVSFDDEKADLELEVNRNVVKETYVCDVCHEEFMLKLQLISHVMVHVKNRVESEFNFADNASNQASVQRTQNGPVLRECLVRLERISLEADLILPAAHPRVTRHASTDSTHTDNATDYVCDICDKIFKRKYKLIQHIQIHIQRKNSKKIISIMTDKSGNSCNICECGRLESQHKCKPYLCDICGKQYKQSSHLGRHKRIHTGNKLYSCNICNKEYTRFNNLRDHKWIHTGHKQYSCGMSNKQFTQLRSLKAHKLIHAGDKPYTCEICKKGFTRLNSMKLHKQTHTGEVAYTCEICKKGFRGLNNIKRHKRTHTGEMPYSCEICKKEFTRKSNLQEHIRNHSERKSYSCDICKKRYTRLRTLKLHENKFHMPDKS